MKKTLKLLAAMGAMMLAACSSEETITDLIGDQTTVTYTVSLPADMSTRAYSDGQTATYLTYAVYCNGQLVDEQLRKNQFVGLEATVSLQLLKGYSYTIVFWADAGPKCPYTIDLESGTITMDYASETTIVGNNEERDAFYQVETISNLSTAINEEIKLYRPFAQLNFGTNDLQADIVRNNAPVGDIEFSVEVPAGLPTTLSLIDGKTSGSADAVTFVYTGVPAESDGTFPVEGYEYVSMNYILANEDVSVMEDAVTLTASHNGLGGEVTCTVNNVPLQRNYRTNIYGSLLTAPAEYTITICPHYIDDFFIMEYEGVFYRAYCDVEMMLDAISKGFNVALLKDMEVSETIAITTALEGTLGINLNGYTLTSSASGNCITAEVPLSVVNGTIDATSGNGIYATKAVALDDLTISAGSSETSITDTVYCVRSIEEVTITDCNLSAEGSFITTYSMAALIRDGEATIENSTINVTGAYPKGENHYCYAYGVRNISGEATIANCTIDVTGTEENTEDDYVLNIYGASNYEGTMNIEDCTISVAGLSCWAYGVSNRSGTATISGCTIVAEGDMDCFPSPIFSGANDGNESTLTIVQDCTLKSHNTSSYAYGAYVSNGTVKFDNCLFDVWSEWETTNNCVARGININCNDQSYFATVYASNCTINVKAPKNSSNNYGYEAPSVCMHTNTSSTAAMYLLDGCKLTSTYTNSDATPADIYLMNNGSGNVYYTSGVTFTDGTNTPVVYTGSNATGTAQPYTPTE